MALSYAAWRLGWLESQPVRFNASLATARIAYLFAVVAISTSGRIPSSRHGIALALELLDLARTQLG